MTTPLVLDDDELALLRFTGDVFFTDESPLVHVDRAAREPADYDATYARLVDRGVIDPLAFRVTDAALNQIAPVTECDARIVHLIVDRDGAVRQEDHWLLDEIAVVYERHGEGTAQRHVFGPDLDPHELVQRLGRHLIPRRGGGERLDVVLTSVEILATVLLLDVSGRAARRTFSRDEAKTALLRLPADDGFAAVVPGGLHGVAGAGRLAVAKKTLPGQGLRGPDATIGDLVSKGVLRHDALGLRLDQALFSLAQAGRARHTLVRTDFRDDDWLVREVTLLPVEGSLIWIAPTRGGFRLAELDGDALFDVLRDATGPHGANERPPPGPQRLAALLAGQPRRA